MSADAPHNNANGDTSPRGRNRRSSITQAALSNLFQLGGSGNNGNSNGPSLAATQPNPAVADPQRRRLSVTTLGLSGGSSGPGPAFGIRRGSMSTNSNNSDSIDESAIEDDEQTSRTAPTTPFARRMSYGGSTVRGYRPGGSPGHGNTSPSSPPLPRRASQHGGGVRTGSVSAALAGRRESIGPPAPSTVHPQASNTMHARHPSDNASRPDQQGFNWSEQLRSRAESTVAGGPRASFSKASSPPRPAAPIHDRARSVSDLPQPPAQSPPVRPAQQRPKPDAFQERILKGDFYMD